MKKYAMVQIWSSSSGNYIGIEFHGISPPAPLIEMLHHNFHNLREERHPHSYRLTQKVQERDDNELLFSIYNYYLTSGWEPYAVVQGEYSAPDTHYLRLAYEG